MLRSGKKPVSCLPCAKRKVRCDKLQPCCHCKRRKGDICEYPGFGTVRAGDSQDNTKRIEKLERYIRSLGGDPQEVEKLDQSSDRNDRESNRTESMPDVGSNGTATSIRCPDGEISRTEGPISERLAPVGHDSQAPYVEVYVVL